MEKINDCLENARNLTSKFYFPNTILRRFPIFSKRVPWKTHNFSEYDRNERKKKKTKVFLEFVWNVIIFLVQIFMKT